MDNQIFMDMEMEIEACRNSMAEGAFGDMSSGFGARQAQRFFQQPMLFHEPEQNNEPNCIMELEDNQMQTPDNIEVDEEEEKRFDEARALDDEDGAEEKSNNEIKQIEDELTSLMNQLDIGKNSAETVDNFNIKMQQLMEHYCKMESKISNNDPNVYLKKQMKNLREEIEELHRAFIEKTQQMQEYHVKFLTCDAKTINLLKSLDQLKAKYANAKSVQEEIKKNKAKNNLKY